MKFPKKVAVAFLMALALCAVGFCKAAHAAEDKPLFALDRLSFAGGLNYAWHAAPEAGNPNVPEFAKEFEAGLYASYNLTPKLSLPFSSVYGFDNKLIETRVGVRIRFGRGQ